MIKKLLFIGILMPFLGMAQFLQNFEGGNTIPAGWTVLNGGDIGTWVIVDFSTSPTLTAHSGNRSAAIGYGSTAHADYLVTPSITVTAGVSDYLSFWARSRDPLFQEEISVMLSTTTPTAAAFTNTLIASVAPAGGASFYKYQYDLSAYVGQTVYIGFYSQTTDMFYFDLDDVEVKGIPACAEPETPIVSAVDSQGATLSWTSSLSSFEVEYGQQGFIQGAGTMISGITATTTTLSGLSPDVSYEYYVRANCGAVGFSTWVGPISFNTLCEAITAFPFSESFNNTAMPACWSQANVSGGLLWTFDTANGNGSITPRTGSHMAQFANDTSGSKTKLVTPPLDLTAISSPQLEFYYANVNWFGDIDELRVFYKTSFSSPWVQIGQDYIVEKTSWTKITLALPNPSATYYVAFEGTSNWARGLNLDDVTISAALSAAGFDSKALTIYPNPTKDFLNIGYNDMIKTVEVINLLGQKVMTVNVNANETAVDLTSLSNGTYITRIITIDDAIKTVKVIKQ